MAQTTQTIVHKAALRAPGFVRDLLAAGTLFFRGHRAEAFWFLVGLFTVPRARREYMWDVVNRR